MHIHHIQPYLRLPPPPIFPEHSLPSGFTWTFSFCIPQSPISTDHESCMGVGPPAVACMPSFLCGCLGIKLNTSVGKNVSYV